MLVVVLNDGETYTDLYGCKIVSVPNDIPAEELDSYVKNTFATGTPIAKLIDAGRA